MLREGREERTGENESAENVVRRSVMSKGLSSSESERFFEDFLAIDCKESGGGEEL